MCYFDMFDLVLTISCVEITFASTYLLIGEDLKRGKDAEVTSNATAVATEFAPDLKEMFSLGPSNPQAGFPPRQFPDRPAQFEPAWTAYYSTLEALAANVLSAFALALGLPEERFFDQYLDHHASAIR